jgi:hypothetical protein
MYWVTTNFFVIAFSLEASRAQAGGPVVRPALVISDKPTVAAIWLK